MENDIKLQKIRATYRTIIASAGGLALAGALTIINARLTGFFATSGLVCFAVAIPVIASSYFMTMWEEFEGVEFEDDRLGPLVSFGCVLSPVGLALTLFSHSWWAGSAFVISVVVALSLWWTFSAMVRRARDGVPHRSREAQNGP
jgi:hypothetical protein